MREGTVWDSLNGNHHRWMVYWGHSISHSLPIAPASLVLSENCSHSGNLLIERQPSSIVPVSGFQIKSRCPPRWPFSAQVDSIREDARPTPPVEWFHRFRALAVQSKGTCGWATRPRC